MKRILVMIMIIIPVLITAQDTHPFYKAFQIKLSPFEVLYDYYRVGLGVEKKFEHHAIWGSLHFGRELAGYSPSESPSGYFTYQGIQAGMKWIFPDGFGEYFVGGKFGYDRARKFYEDDVYYDIKTKTAVLYDQAYNIRKRIGIFADNGYEFFIGPRFSIETSAGFGVVGIENSYEDIENPFELSDVEPLTRKRKYQYKYVEQIWRPAFTGAIKLGWRL